jgi:predicted transcriptional regulator of viral defense system
MNGVFSVTDLQTIFNTKNEATFFNTVNTLQEIGVLSRFKKGVYIAKTYSAEMLSARIDPNAYISMGSVLAKNGLIGTMPDRVLTAVRVGRNRSYRDKDLEIKYFGISPQLYFGFSKVAGIKIADNEKAFIDLLYYRMKGARYSFDELSDVDLTQLDIAKCKRYLKNYQNERFVSFCLEALRG